MMDNCYINLSGRLGNQLFQIANGFAYSQRFNKNLLLNFGNCVRHGFDKDFDGICYSNSIFKKFEFVYEIIDNNVVCINEKCIDYNELPSVEGHVSLNGYFQSLKYFKEYKDLFLDRLSLPILNLENKGDVAFHIRRGDYLGIDNARDICNKSYFDKCFDIFEGDKIDVYTDSPEYVEEEFKNKKFNLIPNSTSLIDLVKISMYSNVVCSNSTFSWWASFLGGEKNKILVPSRWMVQQEFPDIYRKEFEKINV